MPSSFLFSEGAGRDTSGYAEFAQELRRFLPNNIILPLISKLPSGGSLYGYDFGDLTGNGIPDLVISLKNPKARWNDIAIHFFVSQPEGFELFKTLSRKYNEEPLEVAFYIEDGTCYLTDKIKNNNWRVDGYTIQSFVFRKVYHWENKRLPGGMYGVQEETDYRSMRTTEMLYKTETLKPFLKNVFYTVPSYPEEMNVAADLPYVVRDSTYEMVRSGISNWFGPDDCSLAVFSRYDSASVTLSAVVNDDVISGGGAAGERDALAFWLDVDGAVKLRRNAGKYELGGRFAPGTLGVTLAADFQGVFSQLSVQYSGMSAGRQKALDSLQASSTLLRGGAILLRVRIPVAVFGGSIPENDVGYTVAYTDADRLTSRSRISVLATSQHFVPGTPYTFGRLKFIAGSDPPFERDDFRMRPLLKELSNAGVLAR